MATKQKIVLASRSPARRRLLQEIGLKVGRAYPDIDESRLKNEPVEKYVMRLALEKAQKVAPSCSGSIIITVDTAIALGKEIFGKPKNSDEARRTLQKLSSRWHTVYSGTVFLNAKTGKIKKKLVKSRVKFAKLSGRDIDRYISTGEPLRAAGGYSIQHKGSLLVEAIDGCLTNIIGISVPLVMKVLKEFKAL